MNTSRTCGRRSASAATARTAVGASSQFQIPPFHSTISSSGPIAGERARAGPARRAPARAARRARRTARGRSASAGWDRGRSTAGSISRSAISAPSHRSRCFSDAQTKWCRVVQRVDDPVDGRACRARGAAAGRGPTATPAPRAARGRRGRRSAARRSCAARRRPRGHCGWATMTSASAISGLSRRWSRMWYCATSKSSSGSASVSRPASRDVGDVRPERLGELVGADRRPGHLLADLVRSR